MRRVWLCAALGAALLLAGCTNAVPPVPAPTPVSYLSLLDDNRVHPIEGTKTVTIHPLSAFSASATESIEIRANGVSVRFNQAITASGSIQPNGSNFVFVLKTLTDEKSIEPKQYEKQLLSRDERPSSAGSTATIILMASGKVLSGQLTGGAAATAEGQKALKETSLTRYLMILAALGQSLHQSQVIDRDCLLKSGGALKAQFTVQGYGTFQHRPVVVLTFVGTDTHQDRPEEPSRIAGFVFLDIETGISAYWDVDVVGQKTNGGNTTRGTGNLTMRTDLSGAGQSL